MESPNFLNALRKSSLNTIKVKRFINSQQTVINVFLTSVRNTYSLPPLKVLLFLCISVQFWQDINLNSPANENPLARSVYVYWLYFAPRLISFNSHWCPNMFIIKCLCLKKLILHKYCQSTELWIFSVKNIIHGQWVLQIFIWHILKSTFSAYKNSSRRKWTANVASTILEIYFQWKLWNIYSIKCLTLGNEIE